ncbi:hypothetical protein ACEXQB_001380 [Herbiconiux sp. P18]|uniref:hypothetical protein n=1 Tax=Herbiconiux liangxiaofengii TaxID=3342795 RepID=UPI0035B7CDB2
MRSSTTSRRGIRRGATAAAALALTAALALAGCTTTPEPEPDPLFTAAKALREQLGTVEGITDVGLELSGLELTLEFAVDDPARAEEATLDVLAALDASDVPAAVVDETAADYGSEPRYILSVVEPGTEGAGWSVDLPLAPDADRATLARAVDAWVQMDSIEGVDVYGGTFASGGFEAYYGVGYEGLLAGVRPTAVQPQLAGILTERGFDPAASALTPVISAPDVLNTPGGEGKSVLGSRLNGADGPLKAVAGPNYGSVLYFVPSSYLVDIVLLPKLAADGTLLPLELTEQSVLDARPVIQAEHLHDAWELRDVIVFTQEGSITYPQP